MNKDLRPRLNVLEGKKHSLLFQGLIFIAIQLILAYFLKQAFWKPGSFVYTFGGDGAFIYYNMIFHTFFGQGLELTNMNYPKFESILMTDAQASLAYLFSKIQSWSSGFFTPDKVIGWMHRFHYIMIGLAAVYAFKALEIFKVNRILSIPASILIVLMSPMMIRLTAGHFGLAYPFVFTFIFFFLFQYYKEQKTKVINVMIFISVIFFFGLNNFYIGMINLATVLLVSLFVLIDKKYRNRGYKLTALSVALVLILYIAIKLTDPGMDRVEIQWGYYSNSVDISSFLYPPTGLLNNLLSQFGNIKTYGGETWVNLGFIPILILLLTATIMIFKKGKDLVLNEEHTLIKSFIGTAIVLLLYASAIFYRIPFLKENFFHQISLFTMFKASARFAWPIYFMVGFSSVILLSRLMKKTVRRPQLGIAIIATLLFIWSYEVHLFLNEKVFVQMHGNPYNENTKAEILEDLKDHHIDIESYQAMYSVPVMEGWNDKFQIVPHFNSEYNAILLSLSTGIPMINGMLSRIGVTDAAEALQLSAHPLIDRKKISALDPDQMIVLLHGKGAEKLTDGERFLLRQGTIILDKPSYQLLELYPRDLNHSYLKDSISNAYSHLNSGYLSSDSIFYIGESFDDEAADVKFAGEGSQEIDQRQMIIESQVPSALSGTYEASIYVHLDDRMYGMPHFEISAIDADGQLLFSQRFHSMTSKDYTDAWIRASCIFTLPPYTEKITFEVVECNQTFYIDEFLLRSVVSDVVKKNAETNEFLFNNYKWIIN